MRERDLMAGIFLDHMRRNDKRTDRERIEEFTEIADGIFAEIEYRFEGRDVEKMFFVFTLSEFFDRYIDDETERIMGMLARDVIAEDAGGAL